MKKMIRKVYNILRIKYPNMFSFYGSFRTVIQAKRYAKMDKRLDNCAAQIAFMLHKTDINLIKGKVCMEVGSGFLLTHSIIFYLLGAKRVIATDYNKLAEPKYIKNSIDNSYLSSIRDILSPFEDHEILRERINKIQSIKHWDLKVLKEELNIEYIAPVNLINTKLNSVDFIFSLSVLEHVGSIHLKAMIKNLSSMMNKNGNQFHFIHLEDHYGGATNPFGFLNLEDYSENLEHERGNRVRASTFLNYFNCYNNTKLVYAWQRNNLLPSEINHSIVYKDNEDLQTSHIGLWVKN
jgi:hypothetical protein